MQVQNSQIVLPFFFKFKNVLSLTCCTIIKLIYYLILSFLAVIGLLREGVVHPANHRLLLGQARAGRPPKIAFTVCTAVNSIGKPVRCRGFQARRPRIRMCPAVGRYVLVGSGRRG